ncbi:hypothetical protein GGI43DRAFT_418401 [Trichoderma evansii]
MSRPYTVSIENERGANTNYAIFMDLPSFTGAPRPWMNVFFTEFLPEHGNFQFLIGQEFYACTAIATTPLSPGVVILSGISLPAILGTDSSPGSTFDGKIDSQFPLLSPTDPSATSGSFEIKTGTDFPMPNERYLVGLGQHNRRGQVVPVATVAPQNNATIQITPKMKFFVTESQQVPGEIVDYDYVARSGATVDFSSGEGQGKHYARVVQQKDGSFIVTYGEDLN